MQHLRIVGVNDEENVPQLILSDESGHEFALPVDEALRHAANRTPVRPASSGAAKSPLTPREIQARLRAGATVEQVVAASGLTTAHVERYAGPVQAERAYVAQRARSAQVAPASAAEAHRAAFGDDPATLEAMVSVRLRAMDVELDTLTWDSWRREDGLWQISCAFDVDSSATHGAGIGLRPPAEWTFQPETLHLRAINRWAESLSALTAPSPSDAHPGTEAQGSSGRRRLSAVDSVFDVEDSTARGSGSAPSQPGTSRPRQPAAGARGARTQAPRDASPSRTEQPSRSEGREHEDLLDVLRARRGQRLGADAEADDRLALMLNRQDPQDRATTSEAAQQDEDEHSTVPLPRLRPVRDAHQGKDDAELENPEAENSATGNSEAGSSKSEDLASGGSDPAASWPAQSGGTASKQTNTEETGPNDGRLDAWGFAYEGESEERGGPGEQAPAAKDAEPAEAESTVEKPRKRAPARRASMPKWDDILFGSKND